MQSILIRLNFSLVQILVCLTGSHFTTRSDSTTIWTTVKGIRISISQSVLFSVNPLLLGVPVGMPLTLASDALGYPAWVVPLPLLYVV